MSRIADSIRKGWLLCVSLLSVVAAVSLCGTATGAIYWAGGPSLGVVNTDGSNATIFWSNFVPNGVHRGCGLALDSDHIYWADESRDVIGRARLDGTEVELDFITGAKGPCGVAVNQDHIFWANRAGSTIGRANVDGSDVAQNFITGQWHPCGVEVYGEYIYWTDHLDGPQVNRADLDGGNFVPGLIPEGACGVAVDGQHIFWTTLDGGTLGRSNMDGSSADPSFITGVGRSCDVTSDGNRVYWTETDESFSEGGVSSATVDGADVRRRIVGEPGELCGVAVNSSYWGGPAPPRPSPDFEFGRIRHDRKRGVAYIPVRFPASGNAEITVDIGLKVRFLPERADRIELSAGGVKWLRVAADKSARFGRKTLQRLRHSGKSKVRFGVLYIEEGRYPAWRVKRFKLLKNRVHR